MKRVWRLVLAFLLVAALMGLMGCAAAEFRGGPTPEYHPGHPGHEVH